MNPPDEAGLPDRKTETVRKLLREGPRPVVPADLADRARYRGERLRRQQRATRRALWLLLALALGALLFWAATTEPWLPPPSEVTPSDHWRW